MVPAVPSVLNGIARTLLTELMPQLRDPYATQSLQLGAMLAMMAAQEFDRAAARLAAENDALLALLGAARGVVADAGLRADLDQALGATPPALLVSALHERNRSLRGLLIRLHAHVEGLDGDAARALETRIWAELAESTRRRQLEMAMPS